MVYMKRFLRFSAVIAFALIMQGCAVYPYGHSAYGGYGPRYDYQPYRYQPYGHFGSGGGHHGDGGYNRGFGEGGHHGWGGGRGRR